MRLRICGRSCTATAGLRAPKIGSVMVSTLRKIIVFAVTVVALVVLFSVAVNTGSLKVSPEQLFNGLFVAYDDSVATIYDLRFPRIFIALLGGASLAVSGVLLQAVIRNPLADPGIIGCKTGISCAAAHAFTGETVYFCPRPRGRSGCVTTAMTSARSLRSARAASVGTAKEGVPIKTTRSLVTLCSPPFASVQQCR